METLAEFLVDAATWTARNSLAAGLFAVVVLILTRVLGDHLHPRLVALLWIAVGLRLVLPVAPESTYSVFRFFPASAVAAETFPAETEGLLAMEFDEAAISFDYDPFAVEVETPSSSPVSWTVILGSIWAAVVISLIVSALVRQISLSRRLNRLPRVTDPELRANLSQCLHASGTRTKFRFVEGPEGCGVAVFGFFEVSHLIVPGDFSKRYTAAEIRGILLHELAHIRRHDLIWNWVAFAIQSLHWFNPLAWVGGRQFLAVRETLCDLEAMRLLRGVPERHDYAAALVKALEQGRLVPAPAAHPALAPFSSRTLELKHRLTMILNPKNTPLSLQLTVTVLVAALGLFTFTSATVADEEREGARESAREGDSPREGERESGRSSRSEREGEREGDKPREGERESGRSSKSEREGEREGDQPREGERESARSRSESREDGEKAPAMRDGAVNVSVLRDGVEINGKSVSLVNLRRELDGIKAKSAVLKTDQSVPYRTVETVMTALKSSGIEEISFGGAAREGAREGARDGEGSSREGARDGEGGSKTGPRDGEGSSREGARDGEGGSKTGPRDGEGSSREGARDGEGGSKTGPRDGEGSSREGARDAGR